MSFKFTKYAIGYSLLALSFALVHQSVWFVLLAFWGGEFVLWAQFSPTPRAPDLGQAVSNPSNDDVAPSG